jgi:hypothetical protein
VRRGPLRRRAPLAGRVDPADSLPEILVGLVMVIGVTSSARLDVIRTDDGVGSLLVAAFATTLAWAIIDGSLSLLAALYDAGRWNLLVRRLRAAGGDPVLRREAVRRLTGGVLDDRLATVEAAAVADALADAAERAPVRARVTAADVRTALAIAGIVLSSTIPPVLPFLLPLDPEPALWLSNALGVVSLFAVGYLWSRSTTLNRWLLGIAVAAGGALMVALTVVLDVA